MTDTENHRTTNTVHGTPEALVQAGTVHGSIHIGSAQSRPVPVPRQLPLPATGFVDRVEHLRQLDALSQGSESGVPIGVLAGPPGIGKTALAVHWAHGARGRFPDGTLYAGVHGHAPGPRTQLTQILDAILRSLGVHPDRIPLDLDGRSSLYRSEIDGRRLLVVVDDVRRPDQVRPLLPASPGCMVLVTSRSTLPGLVAREGAQRLPVGVLPAADSVALLKGAVGQRVEAEGRAAHELAEHCARLPLALRVAAERLIDRPDAALSDLVGELTVEGSRLDAFAEEDELSDLRSVMSASYRALDGDTARFFRRLGLHPGPEFSPGAAAALTGTPLDRARKLLDQLTRSHLVERPRTDRYRLHDLVRLYALERVEDEDGADAAREAVGDVARWYTHTATRAQLAEHPNFPVVPGGEPPEELPVLTSVEEARTWFGTEHTNLVAAAETALEHGHHETAWRLPATVYPLFEMHRHWHQWRDLHTLGLRAAEEAGHAFGAARNHLGMGDAQWLLGELEEAASHYRAALEANRGPSDAWVEGFALRQLGEVSWQRGEHESAHEFLARAIEVFRESGERRGEAMGLLSLAESSADSGRWEEGLDRCRSAVTAFEDIDDVWSVAWAGCTLGRVLLGSGRAGDAAAQYRAAIAVFEEHQDADSRAVALLGLGETHAVLGEVERARQAWGSALDHFTDHGDPRSEQVTERLRGLDA